MLLLLRKRKETHRGVVLVYFDSVIEFVYLSG